MAEFSPFDLLPMLPTEGPPLPRFMGVVWNLETVGILASVASLVLSLMVVAQRPEK